MPEHTGANVCPPDLQPDRVSAFLLQLSSGAKIEEIKFALARLPDVRIIEGNNVLTSSRQALSSLLIGIAVFTAVQLTALLIVVSLLFSAIVQERYREVGLLRAMGARPDQVMTIILAEAAIITGLAGLAGLVFGAALLHDIRPLTRLLFRSARHSRSRGRRAAVLRGGRGRWRSASRRCSV